MSTITQDRAQVRSDLFKFAMRCLEALGASQTEQANAMVPMLAKAFEIEAKLSDSEVRQALKDGPGDELLKELGL